MLFTLEQVQLAVEKVLESVKCVLSAVDYVLESVERVLSALTYVLSAVDYVLLDKDKVLMILAQVLLGKDKWLVALAQVLWSAVQKALAITSQRQGVALDTPNEGIGKEPISDYYHSRNEDTMFFHRYQKQKKTHISPYKKACSEQQTSRPKASHSHVFKYTKIPEFLKGTSYPVSGGKSGTSDTLKIVI